MRFGTKFCRQTDDLPLGTHCDTLVVDLFDFPTNEFSWYILPSLSFVCLSWLHVYEHKLTHYANTPVQYLAIFHGSKKDNFQSKNYDVFLIFAQNIDCGYSLEPPQ